MRSLVEIRRTLHAHPELGWAEKRTTALVVEELTALGLAPRVLDVGTGVVCDVGPAPAVLLRADLDALPLADAKDVPYRSTVEGVCHACGHDVHTTALIGAARLLRAGGGSARLLFQPAEEVMPGGALAALSAGVLDGIAAAYALHCDPALDVGHVGLRTGPMTAAADLLEVRLTGPGGHTSRPQRTVDLVGALAHVVAELPAVLSRAVDPRASLSVVFGSIAAGVAANAIPAHGSARGTVRVFDRDVWHAAREVVTGAVRALAAAYGADAEIAYTPGVPPVVNDAAATAVLTRAAESAGGPGTVVSTAQSLGGEDFGWLLEQVPGAMGRLGVHVPGEPYHDLHQPSFDVDERCLDLGAATLAAAAAN
ncbi:MAG TPA: amidohydrolase [Mycobacteriales bacterium]